MASNSDDQVNLRVVSWNCQGQKDVARHLPANTDIALLQETAPSNDSPRMRNGPGPATVMAVSDRFTVEHLQLDEVPTAAGNKTLYPSSYPGTIAMSLVTNPTTGPSSMSCRFMRSGRRPAAGLSKTPQHIESSLISVRSSQLSVSRCSHHPTSRPPSTRHERIHRRPGVNSTTYSHRG